ncbi:hypothetical protein LshimejAT787_1701110 [Lyophyllum shimeji]|uniref:Uncharacterized protein n=1 Tax=Lyophyllum shimeji TaxID=47721 RepID=A0A9P3UQY5_LYOSH|nr:hypothetical protein LshimejAT787_1701110 [Lyophyllum shimeji]
MFATRMDQLHVGKHTILRSTAIHHTTDLRHLCSLQGFCAAEKAVLDRIEATAFITCSSYLRRTANHPSNRHIPCPTVYGESAINCSVQLQGSYLFAAVIIYSPQVHDAPSPELGSELP